MKHFEILLLAGLVVVVACSTPQIGAQASNTQQPGVPGVAAPGHCDISRQSARLNALLSPTGALNPPTLEQHAAEIQAIAEQSASGAADQHDATHEASCRAISLRGYAALLRLEAHAPAALAAIEEQAVDGILACDVVTREDAGTRMDCGEIRLWRRTIDAVKAVYALRAITARARDASGQGEQTWSDVDHQVQIVENSIAHNWPTAPEGNAHKTRVACGFYVEMVSIRSWPASADNLVRQHIFAETFPATMLAAANSLGVPAPHNAACADVTSTSCDVERVTELSRECLRLE